METTTGRLIAGPKDRAEILRLASRLTPFANRSTAAAVAASGRPLLVWAEDAPTGDDQKIRMEAMRRQDSNTPTVTRKVRDLGAAVQFVDEPTVTPGEFLAEAVTLYEFLRDG